MTIYTGTSGADTIRPGTVSAGVVVFPIGGGPPGAALDFLYGNGGADVLDGGVGTDVIVGGTGDDTITVNEGDVVDGEGDDDVFVVFGSGAVEIDGGTGEDTLDPAAGADLTGADIRSVEVLEADNFDFTIGGVEFSGFDTITSGDLTGIGRVTLSGNGSFFTVNSITVEGLDELIVRGAGASEDLEFDAATTNIDISGAAGADALITGEGDDTLDGGDDADFLSGRGGDDRIDGDDGEDTLLGGDGDDSLSGDAGADSLDGGSGADTLLAGEDDTIFGGIGLDLFVFYEDAGALSEYDGGGGNDVLLVSGGNDLEGVALNSIEILDASGNPLTLTTQQLGAFETLRGGSEELLLDGGGSAVLALDVFDLTIAGSNQADSIDLSLAGATVADVTFNGGNGNDSLDSTTGDDDLKGGNGRDTLQGDGGADTLNGGNNADVLQGGNGNDVIGGGLGRDTLSGGAGGDTFRFGALGQGPDLITDFAVGVDNFAISAAAFGGGLLAGVALTAAQFTAGPNGMSTAPAGDGQFVYNTNTGVLLWDADGMGAGAAEQLARLAGIPALMAADISVIA